VSQVTSTDDTPVYGQQNCIQDVPLPLHTWTTFKITFDGGTVSVFVDGQPAGVFAGSWNTITQRSMYFGVPTQLWMYSQDQRAGASINSGYIQSISIYDAIT
jgi:hypothetical protein